MGGEALALLREVSVTVDLGERVHLEVEVVLGEKVLAAVMNLLARVAARGRTKATKGIACLHAQYGIQETRGILIWRWNALAIALVVCGTATMMTGVLQRGNLQ